jgi:hypothetical protein
LDTLAVTSDAKLLRGTGCASGSGERPPTDDGTVRMSLLAAPNPTMGSTSITLTSLAGSLLSVAVVDVRGHIVRHLARSLKSTGRESIAWDASDDTGTRVRPGIYFVRMQTAGGQRTTSLIVLR